MEGASASGGIELAQPFVGMLFEVAILLFFLLRGGKKMLHIVDFRHHVLHKCPHSGVGAQAGQCVFEGAVFSAVDADMQMLVVGVEHEIGAFLLHFVEAHRVLEREMFDGYGAFAHVETFLAEHLFDKDVSRGVIHVGREGNVGRDGHCHSLRMPASLKR